MSFWSAEYLLANGQSIIKPFQAKRVKHGAYELSVGSQYYVTSMKEGKEVVAGSSKQIRIPPGQLALLITEETIELPVSQIAFISIKFKWKKDGLINVSGFHVDPGFSGRLKFSVYNAGSRSVFFDVGQPLFLIWFSELIGPPGKPYDGDHNHQKEITAQDVSEFQGDVASPAELKREIDALSSRVTHLWAIALVAVAALLGPHLIYWMNRYASSTSQINKSTGGATETGNDQPDGEGNAKR